MLKKAKGFNPAVVRWIPFFAGFIAGILFLILMGRWFLNAQGVSGFASLSDLKYLTVNKKRLLLYVLGIRWRVVVLMIFLSVTILGRLFRIACTAWYGFSFGAMLMSYCMLYQGRGLIFVLISQFPQILLYVPAYLLLCDISRMLYQCTYSHRADMSAKEIGWKLTVLACLVMAGCFLESYANPILLQKFLKNF